MTFQNGNVEIDIDPGSTPDTRDSPKLDLSFLNSTRSAPDGEEKLEMQVEVCDQSTMDVATEEFYLEKVYAEADDADIESETSEAELENCVSERIPQNSEKILKFKIEIDNL